MPSLAPPLSSAGAAGDELKKMAETRPTVTVQSLNGQTDAAFKFVSSNFELSLSAKEARKNLPQALDGSYFGARSNSCHDSGLILPSIRIPQGRGSRSMQMEQRKNPTGAGFGTRNGNCTTTPILVLHRAPLRIPGYLAIGYYLPRRRGTPFLGLVCVLMREDVFWLPRKKHFPDFLFSRDLMTKTANLKHFWHTLCHQKRVPKWSILRRTRLGHSGSPPRGKDRKGSSRLTLNGRGKYVV
jgi:hypothetical protein